MASLTMDVLMEKSKRKIFIKYTIERKGSAYFKDGQSDSDRTDKLKRK